MVKLLDSTGLAQLWKRIKGSFVSNRGGIINSEVDDEGLTIQNPGEGYTIFCPQGITTYNDAREIVSSLGWGDLLLNRIHLKNGTSSQVLIADGSVKTINVANGICGLDANGRIPLAQLGNLDTSLFKIVTSLPSSGESNKIYIVKDGSDANDVYQEYYYTNGAWEKIGTHAVKVDLTPYAKKSETIKSIGFSSVDANANYQSNRSIRNMLLTLGNENQIAVEVPLATPRSFGLRPDVGNNGFMSASDKGKLDGIAEGANNYTLPTASASALGGILIGYSTSGRNYAVLLDGSGKAYVNVPWTDTHVTVDSSLSSSSTNPVQNKVVNAQFNTIAKTLTTINQSINNLNYTVLTSSEIDAILV